MVTSVIKYKMYNERHNILEKEPAKYEIYTITILRISVPDK